MNLVEKMIAFTKTRTVTYYVGANFSYFRLNVSSWELKSVKQDFFCVWLRILVNLLEKNVELLLKLGLF